MIFFRASALAYFENFELKLELADAPDFAPKSPLRAAKLDEGIFRLGHFEFEDEEFPKVIIAHIIPCDHIHKTAPQSDLRGAVLNFTYKFP